MLLQFNRFLPLGSSNQQSQNGVFERTPLHTCHVISPPICFSQRLGIVHFWKLKQDEGWLCGGVCLACVRLQAKLSSTSNENKSTPKPEVACVTTLRFFLAEVLCSPAWCCLSVRRQDEALASFSLHHPFIAPTLQMGPALSCLIPRGEGRGGLGAWKSVHMTVIQAWLLCLRGCGP